jgi:hypothetical protein
MNLSLILSSAVIKDYNFLQGVTRVAEDGDIRPKAMIF